MVAQTAVTMVVRMAAPTASERVDLSGGQRVARMAARKDSKKVAQMADLTVALTALLTAETTAVSRAVQTDYEMAERLADQTETWMVDELAAWLAAH